MTVSKMIRLYEAAYRMRQPKARRVTMKFFDDNGNEITMEQAIAMSPEVQERIRENERVLNQTEEQAIEVIARRLMGETRPPASWDDAMEIARDTYAAMTAEGD